MEKMLANFLKAMGLTPEYLEKQIQGFAHVIDDVMARLQKIEKRNERLEIMLVRLCKKSKVDISDIYEPIDDGSPVIDHGPANDENHHVKDI